MTQVVLVLLWGARKIGSVCGLPGVYLTRGMTVSFVPSVSVFAVMRYKFFTLVGLWVLGPISLSLVVKPGSFGLAISVVRVWFLFRLVGRRRARVLCPAVSLSLLVTGVGG